MTDLAGALQRALFEQLSAEVTKAPTFQAVPEKQAPPVVIIGEPSNEEIGGVDARFERHELDIVTVTVGPSRLALLALQEEVRAALSERDLPPQPGVHLSAVRITNTTSEVLGDGVTYYGTQRLQVFAQPL